MTLGTQVCRHMHACEVPDTLKASRGAERTYGGRSTQNCCEGSPHKDSTCLGSHLGGENRILCLPNAWTVRAFARPGTSRPTLEETS
jgi:hypothetical protein